MDHWEPSAPEACTKYHRDQFTHHRLRTDSLSPERLFKSSVTMTTDSDEAVNSKQSLRWKKHKYGKRLSCDNDDDIDSEDDVTSCVENTLHSSDIMSSLNKINSQLGEVLSRLTQPVISNTSTIQPYPSSDPLLQPRKPDKTEEELRSKWLYYLGKEFHMSLFIIKLLKLDECCGQKLFKGCCPNRVKPLYYLRPWQRVMKSSKRIHLKSFTLHITLCGT